MPGVGPEALMPHVYGALPRSAVVGLCVALRGAAGSFDALVADRARSGELRGVAAEAFVVVVDHRPQGGPRGPARGSGTAAPNW